MARPRSDNPRSQRMVIRLTVAERGQIEALAKAGGVSVPDYLRSAALGGSVDAARRVVVAQAQADATGMPTLPAPAAAGFRCPFGPERCSFEAPSSAAKCPVHGRTVVAR